MIWQSTSKAIEVVVILWFVLLLAAVGWQMLTGRILVSGMLKHRSGRAFGFHRLQMAGVSLLFAAGYVIEALGKGPGSGMPDISTPMLALLVGSHATYLGGKALS